MHMRKIVKDDENVAQGVMMGYLTSLARKMGSTDEKKNQKPKQVKIYKEEA